MTEAQRIDRNVELRLSAWVRIHERLTEEERRRENQIVRMTLDMPGKQATSHG